MKDPRVILADQLAAEARRVMPKHQAQRFTSVVHGKRRDTTPELPPITIDRPFRPLKVRAKRPARVNLQQGRLL